jgi:hypothetical protein
MMTHMMTESFGFSPSFIHRHEFPSLLTATADVGTLTLGLSISADFGLSLSDLAQKEAIKLQVADIHGHSMTFPIYISPHTSI